LAGLDEPLGMHDIDDVVHGYGSEGDDNDDTNSTSNSNTAADDTGAYDENNDGYDEEGTTKYSCIYIYTYILEVLSNRVVLLAVLVLQVFVWHTITAVHACVHTLMCCF
jgi:hypothetical protein